MTEFKVGDKVRINRPTGWGHPWHNFEAEVVEIGETMTDLKPLSDRPDGYKRNNFFWDTDELVLVEPREFKIGDRVHINSRGQYDTDLESAVGRAGVVQNISSGALLVEVEGEKITAYGQTKSEWWFPRSGLVLIEEETKEEKTVTFNEGDKVRILPGGTYEDDITEGVIEFGPDEDNDYYIDEVGYVGAEFLVPFEEFPRPIEFADVKVGDRISARREASTGESSILEGTVKSVETDAFFTETWYIDKGLGYTLTLLERPEPAFTTEQVAAVEALEAAGFSRQSAEAIVKKGDSA